MVNKSFIKIISNLCCLAFTFLTNGLKTHHIHLLKCNWEKQKKKQGSYLRLFLDGTHDFIPFPLGMHQFPVFYISNLVVITISV